MAYSYFGRRNKNLIMANQSVLGNQGIFYCKKGGKIMTIGKKIVSVFLSFLMLFSVCVEAFAGTSMETALNKVNL